MWIRNAQAAGAVLVIVVNRDNTLPDVMMSEGSKQAPALSSIHHPFIFAADADTITIPSVMVAKSLGDRFKGTLAPSVRSVVALLEQSDCSLLAAASTFLFPTSM